MVRSYLPRFDKQAKLNFELLLFTLLKRRFKAENRNKISSLQIHVFSLYLYNGLFQHTTCKITKCYVLSHDISLAHIMSYFANKLKYTSNRVSSMQNNDAQK